MNIKKEEILDLKIETDKLREKIIAEETERTKDIEIEEEKIRQIRADHELTLEPLRQELKTNEETLKEKLLALK